MDQPEGQTSFACYGVLGVIKGAVIIPTPALAGMCNGLGFRVSGLNRRVVSWRHGTSSRWKRMGKAKTY